MNIIHLSVFARCLWTFIRRTRNLSRLPVILFVLLCLCACAPGKAELLAQDREIIRLAYSNEPPYAFRSDSGRVTGAFPEIARRVFGRMGYEELDWAQTEFGSLIPGLTAGRFDGIAAGMFITPERAQQAAFSQPVFAIRPALLVQSGNPKNLHSYRDIAAGDTVTLAVLTGAVEYQDALAAGVPAERIQQMPDLQTGLAAVVSGYCDALALTQPTLRYLILQHPQQPVQLAEPFLAADVKEKNDGYAAFAFRKEDAELLNEFNQNLRQFMASPEFLPLAVAYGFSADDLPGDLTVEQILQDSD